MHSLRTQFLVICCIIASTLLLLLYRVGNLALQSYDEAWYAAISHTIIKTHNPLTLYFNGTLFTDHPPLGFICMSLPMWLGGETETSIRLASVLFAVASCVAIYLAGTTLKNAATGFGAVSILLSSLWFVFRARSGNLDSALTFWVILSFLFMLFIHKKKWAIYAATACVAAAILTKTIVGIGMLPTLVYFIACNRKRFTWSTYIRVGLMFLLLTTPWYIYMYFLSPGFLEHHFLAVGMRAEQNTIGISSVTTTLGYLQAGIGKWYKLFLIAVPINVALLWRYKPRHKHVVGLYIFVSSLLLPFLLSQETEVWHLIPAYSGIALFISLTFTDLTSRLFGEAYTYVIAVLLVLLSLYQFTQFFGLLYPSEVEYSAQKDISIKSKGYQNMYLLDTFYPLAVYYADTQVTSLLLYPDNYTKLQELLSATDKKNNIIVPREIQKRLDNDKVKYSILKNNVDYALISH